MVAENKRIFRLGRGWPERGLDSAISETEFQHLFRLREVPPLSPKRSQQSEAKSVPSTFVSTAKTRNAIAL